MCKSWLGSLSLFFILGCASTGRVVPSQELIPLVSQPQSTLLLFAIDSRDYIEAIHLSGKSDVIVGSSPYQFIELEPGEYKITKLELDFGYIDIDDIETSEIWSFTIKPGVINYVGHFHLKDYYNSRYSFSLENKSASTQQYMEDNHPEILKVKSLVYGGVDRDDFFKFASQLNKEVQ